MKKKTGWNIALLVAGLLCLGLTACGSRDGNTGSDGATASLPTTVSIATGSIATDSWGYTGINAVQLAAPTDTEVVISGRTLLKDAGNVVVSGESPTKVGYSSDLTTLSTLARASAPSGFVSYIDLSIGAAQTATPALSVTVNVGAISQGQTVTVYKYDPQTGRWTSPQSAVVGSTGKITFLATDLSLHGIFS